MMTVKIASNTAWNTEFSLSDPTFAVAMTALKILSAEFLKRLKTR